MKSVIVKSLSEFLEEIQGRSAIRLVKFAEDGLTKPVRKQKSTWLVPVIRVVCTAYDKDSSEIVRFEDERESKEMVSEKERIRERLQLEGYAVEDGEWTEKAVTALLSA